MEDKKITVVLCTCKSEVDTLMKYLYDEGYKWRAGQSPLELNYYHGLTTGTPIYYGLCDNKEIVLTGETEDAIDFNSYYCEYIEADGRQTDAIANFISTFAIK